MTAHPINRAPHVAVLCGLAFEARAASGATIAAICGADQRVLRETLRAAVKPGTRGIISFGFAGGLAHGLPTGTRVVAKRVLSFEDGFATDKTWSQRLLDAVPGAISADLASVDQPILHPLEKRGLQIRTGAVAVDMESHIAGRVARECGLPFAALRIVLDPAHRPIPKTALAGQRLDGSTDRRAVIAALRTRPHDLPAVVRLGVDAWIASRVLLRCRRQLGESFALVDVGHHVFDVA